jgi:short-subunit dehydrogenase
VRKIALSIDRAGMLQRRARVHGAMATAPHRQELHRLRSLGAVMAGRRAGKVCLAGGSIGRATALTFAREGAAVVGCDIGVEAAEQTVALVHGAGGTMVSLQPCLLDDPTECAKPVNLALREFGRLDVVFNLAGRAHFGELENVSDDDSDAARDIHGG